jgi:hypothetical protein
MGKVSADVSMWIEPATTLVATFVGAGLAFALERRRRNDEEEQRRVGAANQALYTLYSMWNNMEQARKDIVEPVRGRADAWLNMPAAPPIVRGLHSFDAKELSFLLQTSEPMLFADLMLEAQRYSQFINLVDSRSNLVQETVFRAFGAAGIPVGSSLELPRIENTLGIDVVHKLKIYSDAIIENLDLNLKSAVAAYGALYGYMKRRYPERKFIKAEFAQTTSATAN